jgi:hypothetical protein
MFLVPVLAQLGLPSFLAARPALLEAGFGARLLLAFGRRVGMNDHDPLVGALGADPGDNGPAVDPSELPPPLLDLLHGRRLRCPPNTPYDLWIAGARRRCRRQIRIGLFSLMVRPARLLASTTYIDVCFTLNQSDLRIRRAGLDLDPGWVSWLGRVVRFHYIDVYDC